MKRRTDAAVALCASASSAKAELKQDWREIPLPACASTIDTDEYQRVEIDATATEYGEALVALDLQGIATESFYARGDGLNAPVNRRFQSALARVYARSGVAAKLREVNRLLRPYGVEVLVWDGYRPIAVQAELWQWNLALARTILSDPSEDDCVRFALRFCSDPSRFDVSNSTTWPTHATGGAVDLTLRELGSHKPLSMGGIYLDPSDKSSTRHYEADSSKVVKSDEEARRNRRLLYWAMTTAGFVNYPFEWWHFDYLTQASIMNRGFPPGARAHYGLANRGEVMPAGKRRRNKRPRK